MGAGLLLFAVNDFPPLLGGEASMYSALVRHLPPRGMVLLAPRAAGDAGVDAALGCEVERMRIPAHGGFLSRAARGVIAGTYIARILARRRVGFILCGQLLSLGLPTRLLAGICRVPYAVFVHGADLLDYRDGLWGRLARWVLGGAASVLVNSRFTAGLVERHLPSTAGRITVLPLGVDPPVPIDPGDVERLRRRYKLSPGPVLLSVARLVPIKGHDTILRALPALLARFPDLTYVVVGDGPERIRLESLARAIEVRDRVIFAGNVTHREIPLHYALATLYVQLSGPPDHRGGVEGFGLSFLEASSYGLPCIGGRSGGVPEAIEDGRGGLLVTPGAPDEFARAAAGLLADPGERKRMSAEAARWARAHTWSRTALSLLESLRRAGWSSAGDGASCAGEGSVVRGLKQRGHRPQ